MNKSSTYLVVNYFPTYRYRTYLSLQNGLTKVKQDILTQLRFIEQASSGRWFATLTPLQLVKLPWVRITLALG
jgi:hypothetical protein